jgi:prepilin-type N-terminal cleavage/methylation domain-containing protein
MQLACQDRAFADRGSDSNDGGSGSTDRLKPVQQTPFHTGLRRFVVPPSGGLGHRWNCPSRGFTLIELLTVICVIAILAQIMGYTITSARERARQAHCMNNLRQFGAALVIYRADRHRTPPWLSRLYPDYIDSKNLYVCRSDADKGNALFVDPPQNKYGEAVDNERNPARMACSGTDNNANKDIIRCSYLYEFSESACPFGEAAAESDGNSGTITWREQKEFELRGGSTGKRPSTSRLPIVRCYQHQSHGKIKGYARQADKDSRTITLQPVVLNVAYEGNIYTSPLWWEGTLDPGEGETKTP